MLSQKERASLIAYVGVATGDDNLANVAADGLRDARANVAIAGAAVALPFVSSKVLKALKSVPNPHGSKGKADHQQAVDKLGDKAKAEAGPGETVLRERKVQGHDSRRMPDQQIVDKDGKTRKVFEAERNPNSARVEGKRQEYEQLKIQCEVSDLNGNVCK